MLDGMVPCIIFSAISKVRSVSGNMETIVPVKRLLNDIKFSRDVKSPICVGRVLSKKLLLTSNVFRLRSEDNSECNVPESKLSETSSSNIRGPESKLIVGNGPVNRLFAIEISRTLVRLAFRDGIDPVNSLLLSLR